MKLMRNLTLVLLLPLLTTNLYSEDIFGFLKGPMQLIEFGDEISNSDMLSMISILENRRWASSASELQRISEKIPLDSRFVLYDKYKVSSSWFFLNVYGIGSLFQGDYLTSVIVVAGMGAGVATNISVSNMVSDPTARNTWIVTGTAIAAGAVVYGLIRPFFFAEEQNALLRKGLFPEEK